MWFNLSALMGKFKVEKIPSTKAVKQKFLALQIKAV